jgi:hypothetical protein
MPIAAGSSLAAALVMLALPASASARTSPSTDSARTFLDDGDALGVGVASDLRSQLRPSRSVQAQDGGLPRGSGGPAIALELALAAGTRPIAGVPPMPRG